MVTMGQLFSLVLLGVLVGLACWPLNLVDHWQDLLLRQLPAFSSAGWTPLAKGLALAPLVVMPWPAWPCSPSAAKGRWCRWAQP